MNQELLLEIQTNLEVINEGGIFTKLKPFSKDKIIKDLKHLSTAGVSDGDVVYSSKTLGDVKASISGIIFKDVTYHSLTSVPGQTGKVDVFYPETDAAYDWSDAERQFKWITKNKSKLVKVAENEFNEEGLAKVSVIRTIDFFSSDYILVLFEDTKMSEQYVVYGSIDRDRWAAE